MFLLDLLVDLLAAALDPFRDSDRQYGYLFLFGMVLLIAAGAGALYYFTR